MHCRRCGQKQLTESVRFCSRCGFSLRSVTELLINDGVMPERPAKEPESRLSPRRPDTAEMARPLTSVTDATTELLKTDSGTLTG